jgi:hypothetical protein
MIYSINYFGQAYGENNYGTGLYSCTTEQQAQGICSAGTGTGTPPATGGTPGNSGSLSNTGIGIIAVVTLACLIVFAALLVRIWRRKPQPAVQSATVTPADDHQQLTR